MILSDVYYLFIEGMGIGGALVALPWVIGYAIASIYKIIKGG